MGFAQLVIGPAGSGKSTYCASLHQHCETIGRTVHIVNLDPAAESFDYPVAIDIRELISLDDVMEELGLGPNGGLIYCMEHLENNLDDWLQDELEHYLDDDYLVFDCPGQIELFSHVPVLRNFVDHLRRKNFNICAVYLLDSQVPVGTGVVFGHGLNTVSVVRNPRRGPVLSRDKGGLTQFGSWSLKAVPFGEILTGSFHVTGVTVEGGRTVELLLDNKEFMTDVTKYISGCMASLSAMIQLELPHVNILSKMDLVKNKKDIEDYLNPEPRLLLSELNQHMAPKFAKLNKALAELVDDYSMVNFLPLDLKKPSSIRYILSCIDNCIQYEEDADVKVKDFDPDEREP